ncbi:DUF6714 family protein [Hydrogenophaga sp. BPS33]|uniref:DUF6714 family protein n=1 Tax=Hydrogenophaga sp. BPS33 TaxID=2651974 RepID=UPI00131F6F76|nr:DUF6714 family protein [Hydrogenophaga sp. BPS33]QHE87238.1 hypothetical protein F9K07_21230 [Hydrogenophaga sp. BPS33]
MSESIDLSLFGQRPYPADKPVVDPARRGDEWESDGTAQFFEGKSNADLLQSAFDEFPYDYSSCHHLLTDEAFSFFLPGLIRLTLENRDSDQSALLGDSLVNTLLKMAKGEMNYRLQPIVDTYNREQLGAIAKFLAEIARIDPYPILEKDPALNALQFFWGQFLPETSHQRKNAET